MRGGTALIAHFQNSTLMNEEKRCQPVLFHSSEQVNPHTHQVQREADVSYICSRYYCAPELIFGATEYTTGVDILSTGCVIPELLLGQPFFPGESGVDQLVEIKEEHFISKLHFTWPQVSCLSGFPARGSLVVFASYIDSADEKQKFAVRFSTILETEDFLTSLEDILSDKHPKGRAFVDAISAISSKSEFVPPAISAISSDQSEFDPSAISAISPDKSEFIPPYRPEMPSGMTLSCTSPLPSNVCREDHQESQAPSGVTAYENNAAAFPPRFTSLMSGCSAETELGGLALALTNGPKEVDLKAQIAVYAPNFHCLIYGHPNVKFVVPVSF